MNKNLCKYKIFLNYLKRIIVKILNKFNFNLNYPGIRFETIALKKELKENKKTSLPLIVCLGDSNTFGWNYNYKISYPQILERKLEIFNKNIKVINCGVGGDTIIDGINRLESDVLFFKPKVVIISFGFNDAMLLKVDKKCINDNKNKINKLYYKINKNFYYTRINNNDYEFYLNKLINIIKNNCIFDIILISLYKINKIKIKNLYLDNVNLVNFQNELYEKYNNIIEIVAKNNNVMFCNLWDKIQNNKIKNILQNDGFHLNNKGFELLADEIYKIIIKKNLF